MLIDAPQESFQFGLGTNKERSGGGSDNGAAKGLRRIRCLPGRGPSGDKVRLAGDIDEFGAGEGRRDRSPIGEKAQELQARRAGSKGTCELA